MTIQELLDGHLKCSCGRPHHCDIETVLLQKNAIYELPRLLSGKKYAMVVSDKNTKAVCGETVLSILREQDIRYEEAYFDTSEVIIPDDAALSFISKRMNTAIDVIIAVDSGVINDLCKAIGVDFDIPVMSVITAPSMDGIASSVSVLIAMGLK